MHILSITARNYRIHMEVTVELDRSRTLIGGPNESGKSTLVEAAHRALFLKSKLTGEAQKSVVSTLHGGYPEVEVRFQTRGETYQITKHFSGANGTSLLTQEGGMTLQGDEAESRLAELLGVEPVSGGRGIVDRSRQLWSHLWIWQGEGGIDPTAYATEQKASLLHRLKEEGGAAAIESRLDSEVANRFVELDKSNYTLAGKPKADSELTVATQANESAQAELDRAEEAVNRLQRAITSFAGAERTITENKSSLETFAEQLGKVLTGLEEAKELQQKLEIKQLEVEQARKERDALKETDNEIQALSKDIVALSSKLAPQEAESKRLEENEGKLKRKQKETSKGFLELEGKLRSTRNRVELAKAWSYCYEQETKHRKLTSTASAVSKIRKNLGKLESALAKLPSIDADQLKQLQSQAAELAEADAALKAMAAGIKIVVSDVSIRIEGEELAANESRIIEEDTELEIGEVAKLEISPGGGTSLIEARAKVEEFRGLIGETLDAFGVETMDEAVAFVDKRVRLEADIEKAKAELAAKDADTIGQDLAESTNALEAARAEIERRKSKVKEFTAPKGGKTAKSETDRLEKELIDLEIQEGELRAERDAAGLALEQAAKELTEHRQSLDSATNELNRLKAKYEAREDSAGKESVRKEKLSKLSKALAKAEKEKGKTEKALKKLQPNILAGDKERFERAIAEARNNLNQAEQDRAVARNILTSDGDLDPEETVAFARARAEFAEQRFIDVERKAKAIRLLMELFTGEQRALSHQFTQPLAEKITGYLQQLFGTDVTAHVDLTDGMFEKLVLSRPSGTFEFDSLSGGAREQVAAAFRLAMAEILAEDYDGSLPIVFDDAFTNSDPQRIHTLQRMLDHAARQGLQVILLTCDPSGYGSLGAKTVAL